MDFGSSIQNPKSKIQNPKTRLVASALSLLVGAALSVLLNVAVPPTPLVENMPGSLYRVGVYELSDHASGLYSPETTPDGATFIWTHPHATVNFTYAANMGRFAQVMMRLASNRPPGQQPARITIRLNGRPYPAFTASDAFQVYTFTLDTRQTPNPYMDPAHVQVDLDTTYFSTSQDPRRLGVAVDWIQIKAEKSRAEVALEAAIWAASALAVALIALVRFGWLYSIIASLGLMCALALVQTTYLPRAISPAVEIGLAGLACLLAVWLAPRARPVWGLSASGGLLAVCLLWPVVAGGRFLGDWQVDDAYISYRYAWNLVHGNGLVFNPGEVVEGYTNFLWTLLAAGAILAGLHPAGVSLAANIAASICLVSLTYYLIAKIGWLPLVGAALLAVDPTLATYGARGGGLEAVPFAFLVLLSFALLWAGEASWRWRAAGGLVIGLAALTRPEGLFVAVLFVGTRLIQDWWGRGPSGRLAIAALLPFVAVVVPYELWRVLFYGYLFPNTFYTKTGTTLSLAARGVDYAWQFAEDHWYVVALGLSAVGAGIALAGIRWFAGRRKTGAQAVAGMNKPVLGLRPIQALGETSREPGPAKGNGVAGGREQAEMSVALALLVGVYTLYIIVVGGDWIAGHRFFVPLLAPLMLLAVWGARLLMAWAAPESATSAASAANEGGHVVSPSLHVRGFMTLRNVAAAALAVALGVLAIGYAWGSLKLLGPHETIAVRTYSDTLNTDWWGSAGLWLRDETPPQAWAAAQGAGAIAYYSQRPVIDMLGLADSHIGHSGSEALGSGKPGHEKKDPAYVLGRRPTYILVVWQDYFTPFDDQLRQEYERLVVSTPTGSTVPWWRLRGVAH